MRKIAFYYSAQHLVLRIRLQRLLFDFLVVFVIVILKRPPCPFLYYLQDIYISVLCILNLDVAMSTRAGLVNKGQIFFVVLLNKWIYKEVMVIEECMAKNMRRDQSLVKKKAKGNI